MYIRVCTVTNLLTLCIFRYLLYLANCTHTVMFSMAPLRRRQRRTGTEVLTSMSRACFALHKRASSCGRRKEWLVTSSTWRRWPPVSKEPLIVVCMVLQRLLWLVSPSQLLSTMLVTRLDAMPFAQVSFAEMLAKVLLYCFCCRYNWHPVSKWQDESYWWLWQGVRINPPHIGL